MAKAERHRRQFAARFRRNTFGWRSQPVIARVQEAVAEVRKVRRSNSVPRLRGQCCFWRRSRRHWSTWTARPGQLATPSTALSKNIATAPADLCSAFPMAGTAVGGVHGRPYRCLCRLFRRTSLMRTRLHPGSGYQAGKTPVFRLYTSGRERRACLCGFDKSVVTLVRNTTLQV